MVEYRLDEVFGVSKFPVQSYIERPEVDSLFLNALNDTRQIVVFGSSKQGKSALLDRHLQDSDRVTVHCGPNMTTLDLYRSILRQSGVEITSQTANEVSTGGKFGISAKFKAMLPLLGGAEVAPSAEVSKGERRTTHSSPVEFNLAAAQDIGELLLKIPKRARFFVLENFHYLEDDVQAQFAFDLRTFEEMGVRFIILGVWRERNRLNQYNGDLQDRVSEVPVEPWGLEEFNRVLRSGESVLNIEIGQQIRETIFSQAHGSIGVVQELTKNFCRLHGVTKTEHETRKIDGSAVLARAIQEKVAEYSTRHVRALETIAAGSRTRRETESTAALYLPYYFVITVLSMTSEELKGGIQKNTLRDKICNIHHRPENVRESDLSGMLSRLAALQANSKIVPPLFDFDRSTRMIKIVDSTLFFFLGNCQFDEVRGEIPRPDDLNGY